MKLFFFWPNGIADSHWVILKRRQSFGKREGNSYLVRALIDIDHWWNETFDWILDNFVFCFFFSHSNDSLFFSKLLLLYAFRSNRLCNKRRYSSKKKKKNINSISLVRLHFFSSLSSECFFLFFFFLNESKTIQTIPFKDSW